MSQTLEKLRLDFSSTAYIMITCQSGSEGIIIDELKSIEGIKEVLGTVGSYDILAKIELPTIESLRDIIESKIRKIPEIRATTTIVCGPSSLVFY